MGQLEVYPRNLQDADTLPTYTDVIPPGAGVYRKGRN
jgi:hypothetical protein